MVPLNVHVSAYQKQRRQTQCHGYTYCTSIPYLLPPTLPPMHTPGVNDVAYDTILHVGTTCQVENTVQQVHVQVHLMSIKFGELALNYYWQNLRSKFLAPQAHVFNLEIFTEFAIRKNLTIFSHYMVYWQELMLVLHNFRPRFYTLQQIDRSYGKLILSYLGHRLTEV